MLLPGVAELVYKSQTHANEAIEKYHNRDLDGQPMQVIHETRQKEQRPLTTQQRKPKNKEPAYQKKASPHFVNPSRSQPARPNTAPQRPRPQKQQTERPLVKKDRRFVPKQQAKPQPVQRQNSFKKAAPNQQANPKRGQRKQSASHEFTITM